MRRRPGTLIDLLRYRAAWRPEATAFVLLRDGEADEQPVTYGDLDRRARAAAVALADAAGRGGAVLIAAPHGLAYMVGFFGCLYAGIRPVPTTPFRRPRDFDRLTGLAADCGARLVWLAEEQASAFAALAHGPAASGLRPFLAEAATEAADAWRAPDPPADALAYLQYTSGATSRPRGVMVTHRNVLHNLEDIDRGFRHDAESVSVSWLPYYHDMGLVYGLLQPLYGGFRAVHLSPAAFAQRPLRWLHAISRARATHSGGPDFAYDLCARTARDQRDGLDLRTWRVAFSGAEAVRAATLDRFAVAFEPHGFSRRAFCPAYGLAEATLKVSATPPGVGVLYHRGAAPSSTLLVGCGAAGPDTAVTIVDPETRAICGEGAIGEIWVSGPGVARGYWNRPEETVATFAGTLQTGAGPFLRTGDLGFLRAAELFVTGRLKDILIINGVNHEPTQIEETVRALDLPGAGPCVACAAEIDGAERLIVLQEIEASAADGATDLAADIRRAISRDHALVTHTVLFVNRSSLPRTTSGKLQRYRCRQQFRDDELSIVARSVTPMEIAPAAADAGAVAAATPPSIEAWRTLAPPVRATALREWLRMRVAEIWKLDARVIDPAQRLGSFGFDSLRLLQLAFAVERDLGVALPVTTWFEDRTLDALVDDLAARLSRSELAGARVDPAEAATTPETGLLRLSIGQQALWTLAQTTSDNSAYHIAVPMRILGDVEVPLLRRAFHALTERHAALRTVFEVADGVPRARVRDTVDIELAETDARGWTPDQERDWLQETISRPFDLARGPLLRLALAKDERGRLTLVLCVHHIVADLWSVATLMRELGIVYEAWQRGTPPVLPPPSASYADVVAHEADLLAGPRADALWRYWQEALGARPETLALPYDQTPQPKRTSRGVGTAARLGSHASAALDDLARATRVSPYMVLVAALQILLERYTGQRTILIGSPVSGRTRPALVDVVGYCTNVVVLRGDLDPRQSFRSHLREVCHMVSGALAHQELPYAALVERVRRTDPHLSTLVHALFSFQRMPSWADPDWTALAAGAAGRPVSLGSLTVEGIPVPRPTAQFDLNLTAAAVDDDYLLQLVMSGDTFRPETPPRMLGHLTRLLTASLADPDRPIAELSMLDAAERHAVLVAWNDTRAPLSSTSIVDAIEAQVARTPAAVALSAERPYTYDAMNRRANGLAHRLQAAGIGPDVPVGVCLERSPELVIALLAVLKAGGAFVPLEPALPADRLAFMVAEAGVQVVVTDRHARVRLPEQPVSLLAIDDDQDADRDAPQSLASDGVASAVDNPTRRLHPLHLAYVIYTSGSTGRPKGAMNTHQALANRLTWMQQAYDLTPDDVVLQKTPCGFDVAVWELFWPLMVGARLVVARPGGHRESAYLAALIQAEGVTTVHFVPSMLRAFVDTPGASHCQSLRRIISSGEALSPDLRDACLRMWLSAALHNLYGPTEAAIDVTAWTCAPDRHDPVVPIGRPIANTQVYVADAHDRPSGIGMPGHVHLAGAGLARGYIGHPGLTADRFRPDAWSGLPGARTYATGDRGRWRADGVLEFLGRLDDQLKIRGVRIEPDEVAQNIRAHAAVRDAAVVARVSGDDVHLVAYVIWRDGHAPDEAGLRAHLQRTLPDVSRPRWFVSLTALPLSPNGKLDRAALPSPSGAGRASSSARPADPLQIWTAQTIEALLHVERVGLDDDFFELGGHSLTGTQLIARIRGAFGVDLPLARLFDGAATVARLADEIGQALVDHATADDMTAALREIQGLSDDEVARLLAEERA